MSRKKEIIFLLIVLPTVFLMIFCPIQDLDSLGHKVIGVTIITIVAWILKPWGIPCSVSGLFLMGSSILLNMEPSVAFSGFAQNTVWTLIPALFFGLALQKSGLGKRLAMKIFGLLPVSWFSVIFSWGIIGVLLSLVTPSMTVRVSIMLPIALNCCDIFELKQHSKAASFLLIYTIMMAILPGNAWLTGGLVGPIIQGVYETIPELSTYISFQSWLRCAFVPVITVTILTAVLLFLFLKPEKKLQNKKLNQESAPVSQKEVITGCILLLCCILFFTGNMHHISNTTICLFAVVLLFCSRVLQLSDFTTGINWDLIVFIGSGLSMSKIFAVSGISEWLSFHLSPVFEQLSLHPIMFVFIVFTILYLWRFIDVTTLMPTMVILAPVIVKVSEKSGLSPMVWTVLFSLAICSMCLSYTNMWTYMGKQMVGDYSWSEGQLFRGGVAYYIACMAALGITVPFWCRFGYIFLP